MVKSNKSSSSQMQDSNQNSQSKIRSRKISKNNLGRPKIKNSNSNVEDQPIEYWFQSEMANKIVQLLGSKGQIIFKCLSGQKAKKYKDQLNQCNSGCKDARQKYLNALNGWKKQLLDKLGYYEENSQNKEKAYLFIGENKSDNEFNFSEYKELNLLKGVIDPQFFITFKKIVEKCKKDGNMPQEYSVKLVRKGQKYKMIQSDLMKKYGITPAELLRPFLPKESMRLELGLKERDKESNIKLFDLKEYDQINDWALFKVLSKPYQKQLEKLQIPDDEQTRDQFNLDIKSFIDNIDERVKEINNQINEFIIDDKIKSEMTQIIEELLKDIQDIIIKTPKAKQFSNV